MHQLPDSRIFTRAETILSDSELATALRHGLVNRLRHGIYSTEAATPLLMALAAQRALKDSVISGRSAAWIMGIPLLGAEVFDPELTLPPFSDGGAIGVHVFRAQLRAEDCIEVGGVRVTSPARTVVDLARRDTTAGVVAMDAAVQKRLCTFAEIDDVLQCCWNWPGIRRAQLARRLSDGLAESPLETLSRLTMRRLHLPAPRPQATILDLDGHVIGRCDFYWEEFGVVGEVDGRIKYRGDDGRDVFSNEKGRQERLEDLHVTMTRWGNAELGQPRQLRRRIERAYERGAARDRSGVPRLWVVRYAVDPE